MGNKSAYKKICEQNDSLPVFLQPWWLDAVCGSWDVAIAMKGEQVTGVWPYAIDKKAGVTILRNPRLTPYLGPHVFYPHDVKESNADRFEHETVSALISQLPDAKVWHLAIQPGMYQAGIFKNNKLATQAQQTFLVDLSANEDKLLADMKESMRRNIRSAAKEVEITNEPAELKTLFGFQKEILGKKGVMQAYTMPQLQAAMDACLKHKSAALWVARTAGTIQAIVWQVWDKDHSYYLMGGQNNEANSYKAMSALLWHTMKEAKARGNTIFDLEGSMDEGVERFFRNFGGQRTLYLVLQKNESVVWKLKKMALG